MSAGRRARRPRLSAPRALGAGVAAVLATLAVAGCGAAPHGLVLERSGLLADRAFDRPAPVASLTPAFRPGGTASAKEASADLSSGGLTVGVGSHQPGTWRGYYLATAATFPAGAVIHVWMSRPPQSVPLASQSGIALLAVQTAASRLLDYVLVAGVINHVQDSWLVGYANGNTDYATTRPLSIMPSAATAQDITLRTDGGSSYTVYFGRRLVYRSPRTLRLNVAPPLRVYLEVEARSFAYRTQFRDFWVAASDTITVAGLRRGDRVTLAPDGGTPVQAVAGAGDRARLVLPLPEAVGRGTFTIAGPHVRRRRFARVAYAGGDVYRLYP